MASQLPLQTNPLCQNVKTNFFFCLPGEYSTRLVVIWHSAHTADDWLFFNQNLKNESNKLNKPQLEESGTMLRCIICTSRQNDDKIMEPFNKKKNEAGRVRVCGPTTGRYWLSSITKWIFSCYDGGGFLSGRCRNRGNGARREHRRPISCKKMKVTSRVFPPLRSSLGHSKPVSLVRLESTISAVLGFSFSFF